MAGELGDSMEGMGCMHRQFSWFGAAVPEGLVT